MDQEYVGMFDHGTAKTVEFSNAVMESNSGIMVDLLFPKPEMFVIEDIAHHLSHLCRYCGACDEFYSVAEHSYWCWREGAMRGLSEETQLHLLMHDASEAYTGDVTRPMKIACPAFRDVENRIQSVIMQKFCTGEVDHEVVKRIDNEVLRAESSSLMKSRGQTWVFGDVKEAPILIRRWRPIRAREEFLKVFDNLYMKAGK